MKYLLDANIIILVLAGRSDVLRRRMAECGEDDFATSAIAYAEVALGAVRGKSPPFEVLQRFARRVPVLPFDQAAARAYATLPFRRASYDRLIAAHALASDLTVVTDNMTHFSDVAGLRVENWTVPL